MPDDIREPLRSVWSTSLGRDVGMDEDIFDMDVSSIEIVELVAALERAGLPVALETLLDLGTVAKVAAHLECSGAAGARA